MNKKLGLKVISSLLLGTMCMYTMPVLANTKDETVYSKMNNNGESYNTIVSTKLSNDDNNELIEDLSDLLNIENTNGDETFSQNGEKIEWKANGNSIQYQGNSNKELPVSCQVKYELDGEEKEAKDIVGKSGRVKITIQYTNNDFHTVKVNGKYVKMYTPFVVVAGTIINNDNNKNIEVSTGKTLDNGTKTTVVGMAMPGLQESLNISNSKINIPNTIEISMDAENFEMNNIISYATPKVLEENDLNMFNNLNEIYNKVNELQSSSKQLVDGANEVKDGAEKLNNGATTLKSGINIAYTGASTIRTQVAKSTSTLLNDKSSAIDKNTLASIGNSASKTAVATLNAKDGNTGKTQLELIGMQASNSANSTINSQLAGIGTNASTLATKSMNVVDSKTGKTQLELVQIQAQQEVLKEFNSIDSKTGKTQLDLIGINAENSITAISLSKEQKAKIISDIDTKLNNDENYKKMSKNEQEIIKGYSVNSAIIAAETVATEVAKTTANQTAQEVAKTLAGTVSADTAKAVAMQVASQVANQTAQNTATQVAQNVANQTAQSTASQVASNVASQTATSVAKQVGNQVKGAALKQVASQMKTLSNGLDELTGGLSQINDGVSDLSNGTTQLSEGANTLATGMTNFDNEGIEKICNYINGDLKDLTSRVDALKELANEYNTFTRLNDGDKGTVKFITIIDSLKKENFENAETVLSNNNTMNENVSNNELANSNQGNETSAE